MKKKLFALIALFIFLNIIILTAQEAAAPKDRLKAHVSYLASDELEGRGPGTAGIDSAAAYIARLFSQYGLKPGGDDHSYFQTITVNVGVKAGQGNKLIIKGEPFKLNESFTPLGFSENAETSGELVFAGYGIIASAYHYDNFEGIDLKGKIALIFCHEPGEKDSSSIFDGINPTVHSELRNKAINAKSKGAVGVIFVNAPEYHPTDEPLPELNEEMSYISVGIPVVQVSQKRIEDVLGQGFLAQLQHSIEKNGTIKIDFPKNINVEMKTVLDVQKAQLKNVVGVLRGNNEKLNQAPIIIGAHYDHLGYGGYASRAPGVRAVHNGADDNASGVAVVLELARHFADKKNLLKRPIIFIAFSGEEMGLIGSTHFVRYPSFPIQHAMAMLNFDTVGRMVNDQLIVFGAGTAKEWDRILNGYNHRHGFKLTLQMDGYGPSDQAPFYAQKIPVLHFFTGANEDYHKPSDDTEKINFDGLARIAAYGEDVVQYLVDRTEALTFSSAGDVKPALTSAKPKDKGKKRLWLGTVPDFTYQQGKGLRLNGVSAGSPCEKAGLKAGDIIIQIDDLEIKSIYELTHVLRNHKAGDEITITFLRDGEKHTAKAQLVER